MAKPNPKNQQGAKPEVAPQSSTGKKIFKWIVGITALLVLAAILWCVFGNGKGNDSEPEFDSSELSINLKDVQMTDFDKYSDVLIDYCMPWRANERTDKSGLSDAVSFPFATQPNAQGEYDLDALYEELREEIIRNPCMADMVIQALINIKLSDGKTLGEINPWMGEFLTKMDSAMALPDTEANRNDRGNDYWLTHSRGEDGKIISRVTREYREYAAMTVTLLDYLTKQGIKSWESTRNWHLLPITDPQMVRTSEANYQEKLPAFILSYIRKDCKAEFTIGFNMKDKRIEIFTPHDPEGCTPKTPPKKDNPPKEDPPKEEIPKKQTPKVKPGGDDNFKGKDNNTGNPGSPNVDQPPAGPSGGTGAPTIDPGKDKGDEYVPKDHGGETYTPPNPKIDPPANNGGNTTKPPVTVTPSEPPVSTDPGGF